MIGQNQAVRAYEGAGAPVVETNAGEANVVEPFRGEVEPIAFLELPGRRVVERPHPLVAANTSGAEGKQYAEHQPANPGAPVMKFS